MSFLSIFKSQMPDIIKRLENVRHDLAVTQGSIEQLMLFEETLNKENGDSIEGLVKSAVTDFGVAMWLKDINGKFLYVNKICCTNILKCGQEEALALTNGDLKNDALAQVCMQSDKKVLESQATGRFIEHAIYPNGTHVWIDTVKTPVFSEDRLIGVTGNAVDITDSVPLVIKEMHKKTSSIEIPMDATIGKEQIIEFLERRKEPRP